MFSRFFDILIRRIAKGLRIPEVALRMFRTANALSGLDRKTLPTELIPLNTVQISRGLLNFTLLQNLDGWVLPYWAERQFDPSDPGFVPRSHLGLSINVTHRNWTAVGDPGCSTEPVIDPRGAVMPLRNGWTVEPWLRQGEHVFFPSRCAGVRQTLSDGLPVVTTTFDCGTLLMEERVFVHGTTLVQEISVTNRGSSSADCALAFAVRPFNAEGACMLHRVGLEGGGGSLLIDGGARFMLPGRPTSIHFSNREEGDSAELFASNGRDGSPAESVCSAGLANGYAAFDMTIEPGGRRALRGWMALDGEPGAPADASEAEHRWQSLLETGTVITTPDGTVNNLIRASVSTLLTLCDGDSITPGPWTYHQFWFRDAALMLRALDGFGYHRQAESVIRSFPSRQESSGYFRSQQGEWDSNGEALWTVWQHSMLSGDTEIVSLLMEALRKGADWIIGKRREGEGPHAGLMPPGLSAEHLGPADRYYWDNWWSLAGLQAYGRLCRIAGRADEEDRIRKETAEYAERIEESIRLALRSRRIDVVPAGPTRGIDCGMIGSCAPWYPLQLTAPGDARMHRTMERLMARYGHDGMFFQDFIHSGKNPYLTLQIAQAWLYAGERERFWRLVDTVVRHASPTLNYPEAIHPLTGGGAMGDGHHGWAAAELALALRGAFVQEMWEPGRDAPVLILLGGIPAHWCDAGNGFSIRRAPVPGGIMSIRGEPSGDALGIEIEFERRSENGAGEWKLKIPLSASHISVNGKAAPSVAVSEYETTIGLASTQGRTQISIGRHPAAAGETIQGTNL